ncbi:MAG: hypothetical protein R3D89_02690 [Sphingomonadaceae bacterium]
MDSAFAGLVNDIYDAPPSGDHWDGVLESISDFIGGEIASLLIFQPRLQSANILSPRSDQRFIQTFFSNWAERDPTFGHSVSAPVGYVQTLTGEQRDAMRDSAFLNDFWRPGGQGIERLRTNIMADRDSIIGFCLHRDAQRDEIDEDMRERYLALLPHVTRSVSMQYRLQQLEFQTHSGQSPEKEGLLAVDRHGRILFADYRADTILARNRWAVSPAGKLRGHTRGSGTRMARAIRSCWSAQSGLQPRGGMFQMTGPAGRALRVDVGAPPGQVPRFVADFSASGLVAALILIEDLAESRLPQTSGLGEMFGLTPAEKPWRSKA